MSIKERHYWTQLRAALTAGQWCSASPAKSPKGDSLSWPELFRKFNKHCVGYKDVAEVASQTHLLAKLLQEMHPDDDDVRDQNVSPHSNTDTRGRGKLGIENDVILEGTYLEQASKRFDALKALGSSKRDTLNLALAYYAFALGRPQECIALLDKVPDLLQFQKHIPVAGSLRSTVSTLAPSLYAPSLTSYSGSFTSLVDNVAPEVRDGRGWAMVETFRSLCLQGMSHERLSPSEPQKALKAYSNAIPLFSSLRSEITPKPSGTLDFTVFHQLRELWRWVERLLWRAVVLSSRTADLHSQTQPECQLWQWLDHYASCSAHWPPNFRTVHRSTVYSLHIRALILKNDGLSSHHPHHISPSSVPSTATSVSTSPTQSESQSSASHNWINSARSIAQDFRAILTASTKFPRAGERNMEVENFVDLCVGIWEAHGAVGGQAGWVIDILWWATRLTFNSSRVLRHLTRLLYLAGDINLAKRTLRLYIQVVGKAYEASKEGVGEDKDTDEYWVDTLVFGARMLLKTASSRPGLEGVDDVKEAGDVLGKARTRLKLEDKPLLAKVLLSEGIYWSLLAIKGQEPLKRTSQLENAHYILQESLLAQPTASGYYHLALSFARRGGCAYYLDRAIECAGHAIAGQPKDVRYWHLLGILLTGAEKWTEAIEILERGAELDEDYGDGGNAEDCKTLSESKDALTVTPSDTQTAIIATEFLADRVPSSDASTIKPSKTRPSGVATIRGKTGTESPSPVPLLSADATEIPLAETLLKSKDLNFEDYPASKIELFERHLQLRMTEVALMEVIEGAEGAEAGWLEIFSWVAERNGPMSSTDQSFQHRQSLDGPQRSTDQLSQIPGTNRSIPSQHLGAHDVKKKVHPELGISVPPLSGDDNESLVPIPITVSPATPDGEEIKLVVVNGTNEGDKEKEKEKEKPKKEKDKEKKHASDVMPKSKRSLSFEQESRGDTTKTKKVQKIFKDQVHKGRAGITAVSRKIGRNGGLRRSNSTPNFHAVLRQTAYQASSIHSRRRLSSILHSHDRTPTESPPPPPSAPPPPTKQDFKLNNDRLEKENRLLSDLWLMSAATFRRLGKIDQAKGAIQEAEVKDQTNPNVWVQLGLYYSALGHYQHAVDTLHKALFISPDDVPATVHLCKLYLDAEVITKLRPSSNTPTSSSGASTASIARDVPSVNPDVDLAAGTLAYLTKGRGWDVPEAWYYLAKAYGMQGRKQKERETLKHALVLSEKRGVREIELALGWCT